MKKLSFILAMVFAASFAMAQPNTALINDLGANNTAYINQSGGVNGNNSATITQIGDKNRADYADDMVSALFPALPLLTDAKGITQIGTNNKGSIRQETYHPDIADVVSGPVAGIAQVGARNEATITQTNNVRRWFWSYAWVKQMGEHNISLQNQYLTDAISHVYQVGENNVAETQQRGGNQRAAILQHANRNHALIDQNGGGLNHAQIRQFSDDNTANLYQKGEGDRADVLQEVGGFNVVNLTQNGSAIAEILQRGDHNTLKGVGSDMATSYNGSELYLDQFGTGNTLNLQQTNGGIATVTQDGLTNTSWVIQN